jgi:hypothetical protein
MSGTVGVAVKTGVGVQVSVGVTVGGSGVNVKRGVSVGRAVGGMDWAVWVRATTIIWATVVSMAPGMGVGATPIVGTQPKDTSNIISTDKRMGLVLSILPPFGQQCMIFENRQSPPLIL